MFFLVAGGSHVKPCCAYLLVLFGFGLGKSKSQQPQVARRGRHNKCWSLVFKHREPSEHLYHCQLQIVFFQCSNSTMCRKTSQTVPGYTNVMPGSTTQQRMQKDEKKNVFRVLFPLPVLESSHIKSVLGNNHGTHRTSANTPTRHNTRRLALRMVLIFFQQKKIARPLGRISGIF